MANIPARRDMMPTGTVSYSNFSLNDLILSELPLSVNDPYAGLSTKVRRSVLKNLSNFINP